MNHLAITGGNPVIQVSKPHDQWPILTEEHQQAVSTLLKKGEISSYGREGTIEIFENEFAAY